MSEEIIIKVENVSKKYCKSLRHVMSYGTLDITRDFFNIRTNSWKLRDGEFWAVDDVSFAAKRGETIGLIGVNGAGKTTLLKMLNGIFMPDRGKITVNGRVGALIDIGAGFHPLLTGRENIYVNGAILGMTKKEIDKRFEEIVDFAGIGGFLDLPVKHYSSGMYVRLGFAIAIHSEPDVFLVDEVLAVGDIGFILKCTRKISEFIKNNGTLIFVSHSMQAIRNNVRRAILLDKGIVQKEGDANSVCEYYENLLRERNAKDIKGKRILHDDTAIITGVDFIPGSAEIKTGTDILVKIHYRCKKKIENPIFTITITTPEYLVVVSRYSYLDGFKPDSIEGEGLVSVKLGPVNLLPGEYLVSVTLAQDEVSNVFDWHDKMYRFNVTGNFRCYGFIDLAAKWL